MIIFWLPFDEVNKDAVTVGCRSLLKILVICIKTRVNSCTGK